MRYQVTISGTSPLLMHNAARGLDTFHPINEEKDAVAKRRPRTRPDELRLRELECRLGLYVEEDGGAPTLPAHVIRSCIERGARSLKQGPMVRGGLIVESIESFDYDRETLGETEDEVAKRAQFTTNVVVQRSRILRTRPRFDVWACTFIVNTDPEQVDQPRLENWLDIAGTKVGVGDWRPEKSGHFGRFTAEVVPLE